MSDYYSVQVNAEDLPAVTDSAVQTGDDKGGKTEGTTDEGTTTETQEGTSERPKWLPEKFKSPEDLRKAYDALEKKQSSTAKSKQVTEAVADKDGKVDMQKVSREYMTNGELSKETRDALTKAGISEGQIDTHVKGLKAIASETRREVASAIGGEEQLDTVRVWAEANLTDDEIGVFDTAVKSGNTALAKLLMQGINARFVEATGTEPTLVKGETIPSVAGGLKAFASTQEVVAAMKDPRYKKGDRAYVQSVERRLAISKVF